MNLLHFLVTIILFTSSSQQFERKFTEKFNNENLGKPQGSTSVSREDRSDFSGYCEDEEYLHKFIGHNNKSQMIWVTWNRTKAGARAVLPNICSINNGLPLKRRCLHAGATAQWQKYNNQTVLIDCSISMFCKATTFEHNMVLDNGEIGRHKNIWKPAEIGEYSCLQDMCLQPNGLQLMRKCYYDVTQQKAQWTAVDHLNDIKCFQHIRQPSISSELNYLHGNISTINFLLQKAPKRRHIATTLLSLLKKPRIKLLPADIQLTSEILKTLVTDYQDIELFKDVLRIAHGVMCSDPTVLRLSAEFNATNRLLETFENYIDVLTENIVAKDNCRPTLIANGLRTVAELEASVEVLNFTSHGVYAHITHNISIFFINPSCAHISGIAIYSAYQQRKSMAQQIHYDSLNNLYYRFIFMNETIHDLLHETNLELAAFIPIDIWRALQSSFYEKFLVTSAIVFKVYTHDGLFVEQSLNRMRKPFSKILSISLPGYTGDLPSPLPFIFRHRSSTDNSKSSTNTGCGYWNYSTWIGSGVYTNSSQYTTSDDLILCSTKHLTQFSYLLGGSYRQNDLSNEILVTAINQEALDLISLIGCSLSLLGLLGIWITALLFKSWRSEASNKVLLNMCVAITLQMVLFLFVNTDDMSESLVEQHSYTKCIILGALLQYSILVLFTWMLIVAILQFQRYVTVIGIHRPKHYIIKSALLAWSLPSIPTLLVALLDSNSYIPSTYQLATDSGICYPSGKGLHFGVILPISVILLANFAIFLFVFYSISHTLSMSMQRQEKNMIIKQIRLSILLFFLLGLSWLFGLFAVMKAGIVFSYLFCLTATLQGFVLFVYFVIIDKNARNSWRKMLCRSCAKKAHGQKSTELQSMTTTSTSITHDNNSTRNH